MLQLEPSSDMNACRTSVEFHRAERPAGSDYILEQLLSAGDMPIQAHLGHLLCIRPMEPASQGHLQAHIQ